MSIPAGWYDDGSGAQRWWDGEGWTEHFAETPAAAPVAYSQQPVPTYAAGGYQQQPYQPQPGTTNGLAITALVLGILGLGVIPVIFGHIALGQLKRNPQQGGKGLAIAGLILGYIVIAFWVALGATLLFSVLGSLALRGY